MPSTTTSNNTEPPWRAEYLLKRSEKIKVDSIPSWKRELLKRLKDKAQAAEVKMATDSNRSNDKLVLDEPILKVSENIFMRREMERKTSGQFGKHRKPSYDAAGHRIIKKDGIVIVESSDPINQAPSHSPCAREAIDVELPSVGIVSRLKGRFLVNDEKYTSHGSRPLSCRSRSSDDILNIGDESNLRPASTCHTPPHQRRYKKFASVDSILPRSKNHASSNDISAPSKKTPPSSFTKKAPVTPSSPTKKSPVTLSPNEQLTKEETVDVNSLHAVGSTERNSRDKKPTNHSEPFRVRPKLSDRTQEFSKGTVTLHASSCEKPNKETAKEEIILTPETFTLSTPTYPNLVFNQRTKSSEREPKVSEKIRSPDDVPSTNERSNSVKTSELMSQNKENIPEKPLKNATPGWSKQSKVTESQKSHVITHTDGAPGGQIIELGRISMDPSQLKSKAAIAANEIMKDSRTFKIVPRGKKQKSDAATRGNPPAIKSSPAVVAPIENGYLNNAAQSKADEVIPTHDAQLPSSSIDDVISSVSTATTGKPGTTRKADLNGASQVPSEKLEDECKTTAPPPSKPFSGRSFVINSSSNKVKVDRSADSKGAVTSMFGAKLNSTRPANKSSFAGRGSFVIDPSKFKKPTSQQPVVASATTTTKDSTPSSGTLLIVPKSRAEPTPAPTSTETDDGSVGKGKRKLTADQIVVIGGYVKLDHSSLSKPNKMRKGVRVKFEESHLESVYQYPSESSLLKEEHENQLSQRMSNLSSQPGESQLGKYTPKYLLTMSKNELERVDGEGNNSQTSDSKQVGDVATPLADEDAVTFSGSTTSSDLLF